MAVTDLQVKKVKATDKPQMLVEISNVNVVGQGMMNLNSDWNKGSGLSHRLLRFSGLLCVCVVIAR